VSFFWSLFIAINWSPQGQQNFMFHSRDEAGSYLIIEGEKKKIRAGEHVHFESDASSLAFFAARLFLNKSTWQKCASIQLFK
jgi:5-enolpyruvylshikimate-3-phosphate synthase